MLIIKTKVLSSFAYIHDCNAEDGIVMYRWFQFPMVITQTCIQQCYYIRERYSMIVAGKWKHR
jgi:hypothetical protein